MKLKSWTEIKATLKNTWQAEFFRITYFIMLGLILSHVFLTPTKKSNAYDGYIASAQVVGKDVKMNGSEEVYITHFVTEDKQNLYVTSDAEAYKGHEIGSSYWMPVLTNELKK